MSAEFRFLTKCLRQDEDARGADLVAWAHQQGVDWMGLIQLARKHGVLSSLFVALRPASGDLPKDCREQMTRDYHAAIGRNVFVVSEFEKVIRLLRQEGIRTIPYKGPMLSLILFGQAAARESKDIDLVVRKEDLMRAKTLLERVGYQTDGAWTRDEERFLLNSRKEASYDFKLPYPSGKGKRLKIELHWRLPLTSVVPPDWYWNQLETQDVAGGELSHFVPEALLVILLTHGFRHYWESLKWLADVDLLIRKQSDFDWDRFLALSEQLGVRRVVLFGLFLSRELLGTPLPELIKERLAGEPLVQKLVPGAVENMTGQQRCPVGLMNNLLIRERMKDRIFYLRNIIDYLFVPEITDYQRLPLPRILWPLYWVIRPLKVLVCMRHKYGVHRLGRVVLGKRGS